MNKPEVPVKSAPGAPKVEIPEPDPKWHPVARQLWDSLPLSGQSAFYEPADWAAAYTLCESMSREFHPQPLVVGSGKDAELVMVSLPPKSASVSAWAKVMSELLVTEGARRRVRLELERPKDGEVTADVSELDEYRNRLSGAS